MNKRVLIITYYWPPSGGSGVQRWLKFSKYLPEYGWEPVVFTPENPDFDLMDTSLEKEINPALEVIRFPIWEPYGLFRKLRRKPIQDTSKILEEKNPSFMDKIGIWIRANILIPDPRIFWKKPSVEFLKELIQQDQFDAVITTGPPHSLHLIGLELKKSTGIPWISDFRDPWSQWEFLDTLPMLPIVRSKHFQLEQSVLEKANVVMTISPTFQKDMIELAKKDIQLLTNGFDEEDLPVNFFEEKPNNEKLEILYTGVIDAIRNPLPFLSALKAAFGESDQKVSLRFVGKVSQALLNAINDDLWLKTHVFAEGYHPHEEVFNYYKKADLLLLILTDTKNAKGNIPGKLFEYMSTGRQVLALGDPNGDAAQILNESKAGRVFKHQEVDAITQWLKSFIPESRKSLSPQLAPYSRKTLSKKLAQLLDEITPPLS
jgi:glycosyltransferase involved in cell wall biosynthesis